jgi:hypothetical protein
VSGEPVNHLLRIAVGWKHWIENVFDESFVNDERQSLEQSSRLHLERRESHVIAP